MVQPFGLSTALSVFTSFMMVVAVHQRRLGIQGLAFFSWWLADLRKITTTGDWLDSGTSKVLCLSRSQSTEIHTDSEYRIHSNVLNSRSVRVYLSQERCQTISSVNQLQAHPRILVKTCLRLLGHMASCPYVIQYARLHLCSMKGWLKSVHPTQRHHMSIVSWYHKKSSPNSIMERHFSSMQ